MILICDNVKCKISFTKKSRKQRFCSKLCSVFGICENCKEEFTKGNSRQRFCGRICGAKSATALKEYHSKYKEYRDKRNKQIKLEIIKNKNDPLWSEKIGKSNRNKRLDIPKNIFDCSTRTRNKILKRLKVICCVCKWNESVCDIHHIKGRKILDENNHKNLTILCPNHHRLFHKGIIGENDVKTFEEEYGDTWLNFYYM